MNYRYLSSIFLITYSIISGASERAISKNYDDFVLSTVPSYCENKEEALELKDCIDIKYTSSNGNLNSLIRFQENLEQSSLRKDLINISLKKLLNAKAKSLTLFPGLRPRKSDYNISHPFNLVIRDPKRRRRALKDIVSVKNGSSIDSCFKNYPDLNLDDFSNELKNEISKNEKSSEEILKDQKQLISQMILDSLKVESVWKDKINTDKEIKEKFKERVKIEKELRLIENVLSGRFKEKQSKRVTNSFLGMSSQELIVSTRSKKTNKEILSKRIETLRKINADISILNIKREKNNSIIFKNPLLVDSTSMFESGDIKRSKFQERSMDLILSQKGNGKSTQDGSSFFSSFSKKFKNGENLDSQLDARIDFILENDKTKFNELLYLAKKATAESISEIDNSIEEVCDTDGEKLHHFKPLVREAMVQNLSMTHKSGGDLGLMKTSFQRAHCSMITNEPYSDSNLGVYAAIGAGMLATGFLAPVGVGVILAGGGVAFATVGAVETYNALNTVKLSEGLSQVSLVEKERAREDLSNFRVAASWTVADGILFPLDAISIGGRIVSTTKRAPSHLSPEFVNVKSRQSMEPESTAVKSENAYKAYNEKLVKRYPQYESILKDPAAYVKHVEKHFEKQKAIDPNNPYHFDFSEFGMPALDKMNTDIKEKILEITNKIKNTKNSKRLEELNANLKHLKLVESELGAHIKTGSIAYDDLYETSHFYTRAIGIFDTDKLNPAEKALLEVDRRYQGYKPLSAKEELKLYENRQFSLFQKDSTVQGFKEADKMFANASFNKDKLEMVFIPSAEHLDADIFSRLVPHDIYFMGITKDSIAADGFVRPGGDFWVHDLRHSSAIYHKRKLYEESRNLSPSQIEELQKRSDLWKEELNKEIMEIPDKETRSAARLFMFNYHHDRGFPIAPSSYLPEGVDHVPFLLHGMLKVSGQPTTFDNSFKHYPRAYKWLREFWLKRLPEENEIIHARGSKVTTTKNKASEIKLKDQTLIGTSGVEINGEVSRILKNKKDEVIYINTKGPSALTYANNPISRQGVKQHPTGFGSPVGRLKTSKKKVEDFTTKDLLRNNIVKGEEVTMSYESGVTVTGKLKDIKRQNGKIILMTFEETTVVGPKGEKLFQKSWGTYDMTVMDEIVGITDKIKDK
jgi:hypothetical protein